MVKVFDEGTRDTARRGAYYPTILKTLFQILHQHKVKPNVEDTVRTGREPTV